MALPRRVDQSWSIKAATKSYSISLIFRLAQSFVSFLFLHSKHMAGPGVHSWGCRCLQLCWESVWCHCWRSSGSQGDTWPQLQPAKSSPRSIPGRPGHPSSLAAQPQGFAKDLQGLHSGWIQNICINTVAPGTARDNDKAT